MMKKAVNYEDEKSLMYNSGLKVIFLSLLKMIEIYFLKLKKENSKMKRKKKQLKEKKYFLFFIQLKACFYDDNSFLLLLISFFFNLKSFLDLREFYLC